MLSCEHPRPMYDFVVGQLLKAGWIKDYTFVPLEGYELGWTTEGRGRILLLQEAIRKIEDRGITTKEFTRGCVEDLMHGGEPALVDFWMTCLNDLEMGNEENSLRALVEVVRSWTPKVERSRVLS